jgi:hypothetical protein
MIKKVAVLSFLALSLTATAADAQRRGPRPLEFGIDGGVTVLFAEPDNVILVGIPVQDFRVGFFWSNAISIEPRFHLTSISSGDASLQEYGFELGVLFHPGDSRMGSGLYLRPFAGIVGFNGDGDIGENDGYLGAGVGVKLPFGDRRFATRLEANFAHQFDDGGSNRLGLLFGLSFFK